MATEGTCESHLLTLCIGSTCKYRQREGTLETDIIQDSAKKRVEKELKLASVKGRRKTGGDAELPNQKHIIYPLIRKK